MDTMIAILIGVLAARIIAFYAIEMLFYTREQRNRKKLWR
jgi:hypothetical protein